MPAPATKTNRVESPVGLGALEPDPLDNVTLMLERSNDTTCARCGYELHPTILAGHDRCPECGVHIVLSVAGERTNLGRLLPLVVSLSIGIGTGLTYPLYCLFEESLNWLAGAALAYAAINVIVLTIATRFRRDHAHLPLAARIVILLLIWGVFFAFWRWWATQPV